jgi:hypothetical protein
MSDEIEAEVEEIEKSIESTGLTLTWRTKAMIVGGVVGAAVGMAAAYMLAQRSKDDQPPEMSLGEGVKIGVLVFGLLRSISNL